MIPWSELTNHEIDALDRSLPAHGQAMPEQLPEDGTLIQNRTEN
jgi:hypothetical protein